MLVLVVILLLKNNGSNNIALGSSSLQNNTSGNNNVGIGANCLISNITTNENTAIGVDALSSQSTGPNGANVAIGTSALKHSVGSFNTALGYQAGLNATTGNNNIYIGSVQGYQTDNQCIRIGTSDDTSVLIASTGTINDSGIIRLANNSFTQFHLGTDNSQIYMRGILKSQEYSDNVFIRTSNDSKGQLGIPGKKYYDPSSILDLQPIKLTNHENKTQYGLLPENTRYDYLSISMINEIKKLIHKNSNLEDQIHISKSKMSNLSSRFAILNSQLDDLEIFCSVKSI